MYKRVREKRGRQREKQGQKQRDSLESKWECLPWSVNKRKENTFQKFTHKISQQSCEDGKVDPVPPK